MTTDPIADLLTRMRNAVKANREKTVAPYSKFSVALLQALKAHRFISDFHQVKTGRFDELEIWFNPERTGLNVRRISKPGQRIYIKKNAIKPVRNFYGIALLSTPKGVMTGEEARKAGLGGEYLCEVW